MPDQPEFSREQLLERIRTLETSSEAQQSKDSTALRDSAERLRAILETAVEGIITIDERGIIESMNPAAERIFGYKAPEVTGRNVSVLMPSPFREQHDTYIHNYHRTGQARIIGIGREVVGLRKDGSVFPMDLAVSEVRLANKRLYTGFVRDITERKQAEAQLAELAQTLAEKNKELETIVYVASHDLRSPLVNIQGFAKELAHSCEKVREILEARHPDVLHGDIDSILRRDVPEAVDYIQAGVAKIDTLLSGFLRFSRLGRAALKIERLNMNAMLESVSRTLEFQLKQAGATLQIGSLPDCMGDTMQINQVFTNLLDNALKYLDPKRSGRLEVFGHLEARNAVYGVRDNGVGIPAEQQGKIFEIFHRLNPSTGTGEGLGLTIAQRILERHSGRIWVESKRGEGSTFFVSLPAPPGDK